MQVSVANNLIDARDRLLTNGWIQGAYIDGNGASCLVGSLDSNEITEKDYYNACCAVRIVLNQNSLTEWNDHPKRKKEEVIAILNQAASLVMSNEEF